MESHLTSLAKTVAQISLELKTIKSIEDVIYNLRKEVQDLKNLNFGAYHSNSNNALYRNNNNNNGGMYGASGYGGNSALGARSSSPNNKYIDLHRSCSEPNINSMIANSYLNGNNQNGHSTSNTNTIMNNNDLHSKRYDSHQILTRRHEFSAEKEKLKNWVPSYSNPRKLKKLTK